MKKILLSATVLALAFVACKKDEPTTPSPTPTAKTAPVVTTTAVTSITATTAMSGVTVTSDGGAAITAKGIVWSTAPAPTTALATKTTDGTGNITGLTANTKYYVRAYATNSVGTSYGAELSFTATVVADSTLQPAGTGELIISEFAAHGSAEWVEIYNASGATLNLKDYAITQWAGSGPDLSTKYWLDSLTGTATIAAGQYIVITDDKHMGDLSVFTSVWPTFSNPIFVTSLGLANGTTGDEIILSKQPGGTGTTHIIVDIVQWGSSAELEAFGEGALTTDAMTNQRIDISAGSQGDLTTNWKIATGTPGAAAQ